MLHSHFPPSSHSQQVCISPLGCDHSTIQHPWLVLPPASGQALSHHAPQEESSFMTTIHCYLTDTRASPRATQPASQPPCHLSHSSVLPGSIGFDCIQGWLLHWLHYTFHSPCLSMSCQSTTNCLSGQEGTIQTPSCYAFWHGLIPHWHRHFCIHHDGNSAWALWWPDCHKERWYSQRHWGRLSNQGQGHFQIQHWRQSWQGASHQNSQQRVRAWLKVLSPVTTTLGVGGEGQVSSPKGDKDGKWQWSNHTPLGAR